MKRVLTMIGSIVGMVGGVLNAIPFILALNRIIGLMSEDSGWAGPLTLSIILIVVAVVATVLNAVSMAAWNKDAAAFKKKKGLLITAIIFSFLNSIFPFIMLFAGAIINGILVLFIIGMLLSIASAVLLIVDLCREKGKVAKSPKQENSPKAAVVMKENKKIAAAEELEKKLQKLSMLKQYGVITEDEYDELKKGYIKELLG